MLKSDVAVGLRYALTAPFSPVYAAKKRWRLQRDEWESLGIAQTDMRRKTYVVPQTDAVCITVSKSANTTLKYMLGPAEMTETRGVHSKDHLLTRLIDRGLTLNDLLDGSHNVFTFVRHPLARFWSAYYSMVESDRDSQFIPIVRAEIAKGMNISTADRFTPELVLDYVATVSPIKVEEHFRPQWSCTGIEKLPIDFIGRVETMTEDVLKLQEMGYLDRHQVERYRHLNPSGKREIPDKTRIDRIVRDVYAKDFDAFGYD